MKVLLLKDVYKLGRAGDVKRVADGYGRNYLIPQGLAVLATAGAVKRSEKIREEASARREVLNQEMSGVAEQLEGIMLTFPARASETGKLYGSITTQMIAESLSEKGGVEINRRQIDSQPLRNLGEHTVQVRLTVDLVPEVKVIVYREGETPDLVTAKEEVKEEAGSSQSETEESEEAVEVQAEEDSPPEEIEVEDLESNDNEESEG